MKFSKVLLGTTVVMLMATFANISFAKAQDHDGVIIAYMETINKGEISAAKTAKDKKVDADIMKFSDMMIDQHSENLNQLTDLSQKINIAADETPAVANFKEKSDKDLAKLSKLDDAEFQKAYIQAMIKDHSKAEKMLTRFIKEAQNADLKEYLVNTKSAVEQHLAEAKQLK
jgi:putative membrane protein